MYSTSNKGFVRRAVSEFYNRYAAGKSFLDGGVVQTDICNEDPEEVELRIRNDELQSKCASVVIQSTVDSLESLRVIVHLLVKILVYSVQVFLSLLKLIFTPAEQMRAAIAEIEYWFVRLWDTIVAIVKELGNMLFRLVFESAGLGNAMKQLLEFLCMLVNTVINIVSEIRCFVMQTVAVGIMNTYITVLSPVCSFLRIGACNDHIAKVERLRDHLRDSQCRIETMNCNEIFLRDEGVPDGTLPIASSCWVDYVDSVDDSDSLACSSSDTCKLDPYSQQEVVCANCPLPSSPFINRYGCDTLTKRCTCSRPQTTRTSCTSNMECRGLEVSCTLSRYACSSLFFSSLLKNVASDGSTRRGI